jgi:6-pyruvoyltetrahydropterin/6-carboxytetrahydropterin synthase
MFTSAGLDNGQMVVDFGLLKGTVKDIVDSFDHAYSLWSREKKDFGDFIGTHSDRYIIMPVSPTAEMYSLMFFALIRAIISKTDFSNGEYGVELHSVRVHETDTGYAESFEKDYQEFWVDNFDIADVIFSDAIKNEWKDPKMMDKLLDTKQMAPFKNPVVELQYNI